jgi:hypothetical protein
MNTRPLTTRFWEKVNKHGPVPVYCPELGQCWEWTAHTDDKGYGKFQFTAKQHRKAHRVAWFLEHGAWPTKSLLHRCHNRACIRPAHCYQGTQSQNMSDMTSAGRARGAKGETNGNVKLTEETVKAIKKALQKSHGCQQREIAAKYGTSQTTVWQINSGRTWAHVTP